MTGIAFVNNYPGPSLGGGEVQLLTLVRGLSTSRFRLSVVCAAGSALERELGSHADIQVLPVDFARHSLPSLMSRVSSHIGDVRIVQGTGYLTNLVARWVGTRSGAKVVNRVAVVPGAARLDGESRFVSSIREFVDRSSDRTVDRFVAISHAVEAALTARGIPPDRVTMIPIGIDVDEKRRSATYSLDLNLDPKTRHVGFVGRLERVKGCEFFVRAVPLLAATHPDARFLVAGTGSQDKTLRGLAAELGVSDRIEFLGFLPSVLPLMARLDVVVVPSLSEAAGNTAMEALSLGVPVVASRVGGLPEIVVNGETGSLVDPGDAESIASAVERMLGDPAWARGLASSGLRRVKECFAAGRMIAGYTRLYDELAS